MSESIAQGVAPSVHRRLLNLVPASGVTFNELLQRYTLERFLFRLSQSPHRESFMLKGAMLFAVWEGRPHRSTRDIDLLGFGEDTPERLKAVFTDVCGAEVPPDGLLFRKESIVVTDIREGQKYQGKRITVKGRLGNARVAVQVDVGFGDCLTRWDHVVDYPVLLDQPAPRLRAYPVESVISEKVHAMAEHGMANSRMKDLFDVYALSRAMSFDGPQLAAALAATCGSLEAAAFDALAPLTPGYPQDHTVRQRWAAFMRRNRLDDPGLDVICAGLREFLTEPLDAVVSRGRLQATWAPGGPWMHGGEEVA